MISFFFYFSIPLFVSLIATPVFRKFALAHHIVARQNNRTVHAGEVPKLGGGAIFLAFILGLALLSIINLPIVLDNLYKLASLVIGAALLFIIGAIDDKHDLNCNLKLAVEIAVAILATTTGWRIDSILFPAFQDIPLGVLSYVISILWIVGVTNSFNMIDGLDGLAAGIAFIVLLLCLAISILFANALIPIISIILIGAILGFLKYNMNPAKIFMGDSGSLSLGFLLSCITLSTSTINPGRSVILIPFLLLGLPIADTFLAIIRRWNKGIHPFKADKEHVHHKLVNLGFSQSGAALALIGLTFILGIMAYLVALGINIDLKIVQ